MPRKPRKPKGGSKPRVSDKVARAIDILADAAVKGERLTITEAAARAGMRRESLSMALRRDVVATRAQARVRELIGGQGLILAGARLVELIRSDSDYVSLDAAKHTLAIAGIKPREQGAAAGGGVTVNLILKHVQRPAEPISGTSAQLIDGTTGQAIEPAR